MSSNEFSWHNNVDVVIPTRGAVAVYLNPSNKIVIRFGDQWPDEDVWGLIEPQDIDRLCAALQEAKEAALAQTQGDAP